MSDIVWEPRSSGHSNNEGHNCLVTGSSGHCFSSNCDSTCSGALASECQMFDSSLGAGNSGCDGVQTPNEYDFGHGHYFMKKMFHKPAYCHHCCELLWGLLSQGFVCEVCNFIIHERCLKAVTSPCSSIAPMLVMNPVAHVWSEPCHIRRKFCNVCRKRLDDSAAVQCEICEYYVHLDCQDFCTNDCKEGAMYRPDKTMQNAVHVHHWREGNLPTGSKCLICRKTCCSSECLTGYRCEWCGLTAHAGCYRSLPQDCNFGVFGEIMLSPNAVWVPRTDIPMENVIGLQKRQAYSSQDMVRVEHSSNSSKEPVRTISEDFSSSGESKEDSWQERKSSKDKAADKESGGGGSDDFIKVFDGNAAFKRKHYRCMTLSKTASYLSAVEQALKSYHLSDDPKQYYLSEVNERDGAERRLDDTLTIKSQFRCEQRRASLMLRHRGERDATRTFIKVFAGELGCTAFADKPRSPFKQICVSKDTTTQDAITLALRKFGFDFLTESQCILVETCLDKTLVERVMGREERPWSVINAVKKEGVRRYKLTRFYLRLAVDPHAPPIALFIGNLKPGLSQKVYEKLIIDKIGAENKWDKIDVIYYEYGSMVLLFNCPKKANRAFSILKDALFEDKSLAVLLLPQIAKDLVNSNIHPLMVFVNVKSGGCQGLELITSFRKLLNPHQVFNLDFGGPLPGLYCFRNIPYYKILVCGGDGTVGWALSCLDNVGQDAACNYPPMAIVPLGTGNDLARVLRWGAGYSGCEDPVNVLRDVVEAEEIKLDRWTVIFHPEEKKYDEAKMLLQYENNAANTEDNTSIFVMNNYFGIGIDADLSLDFHLAREENPAKFNSRFHNKGVYFKMGLRKIVNRTSCKDLHKQLILEVDQKVVDLPPIEGIIILNILSWASGANPWGHEKDDHFAKPTHYDGQLEVVGVYGVVHMGQIFSGLRQGSRLAQGGHLRLTFKTDMPVQVDGEPWIQPAGQVVVLRSALKATMLKKTKNKIKRRNTEPSIFFPPAVLAANCSVDPVEVSQLPGDSLHAGASSSAGAAHNSQCGPDGLN